MDNNIYEIYKQLSEDKSLNTLFNNLYFKKDENGGVINKKLDNILDILSKNNISSGYYNIENTEVFNKIYSSGDSILNNRTANSRYNNFNIKFSTFLKTNNIQCSGKTIKELKEKLSIEACRLMVELRSAGLDMESLVLDCGYLSDDEFYKKYFSKMEE